MKKPFFVFIDLSRICRHQSARQWSHPAGANYEDVKIADALAQRQRFYEALFIKRLVPFRLIFIINR